MERSTARETGARLREARLRQGSTLAQMGAQLDVAPKWLRALEWGRADLFPDAARADGLARAYAAALDAPAPVEPAPAPAPVEDTPEPRRRASFFDWTPAPFLVVLVPALVAVGLVLLFDSAGGGGARPPQRAGPQVRAPAPPPSPAPAGAVAAPAAPAVSRASAPVEPRPARLEVSAPRGDSWLVVRVGSATGDILFSGVLRKGSSLRFVRPRLWIRLGAATNVDVRVNGAPPRADLYGTLDALVTARGLEKVPTSS